MKIFGYAPVLFCLNKHNAYVYGHYVCRSLFAFQEMALYSWLHIVSSIGQQTWVKRILHWIVGWLVDCWHVCALLFIKFNTYTILLTTFFGELIYEFTTQTYGKRCAWMWIFGVTLWNVFEVIVRVRERKTAAAWNAHSQSVW